ncbi:MAG: hypothetical protein B6244_00690 [Candidatus Cloacimonetes bacterium 4572_55]|nr:MAG: hypothetical protein B6244_00690 [Candidatus Cloacimonetes bacterium 4572_55]
MFIRKVFFCNMIFIFLFSLVFAPLSFSQESQEEDWMQEPLDDLLDTLLDIDIITASKQKQKASDAPATVYVVTEKSIKNRGYNNLEDLLEDIPGIEIQKKALENTSNIYTLRGIHGSEKFVILMDGFRISSPTGDPHVVGTNFSLSNAKRVEVILGPASAIYGADAFSGIVHIITKTGDEAQGGKVTGSFGQFNTTDNSFIYGNKIGTDFSYVLTGHVYHSDEANFPDIYKEEFSWYNDEYQNNGNMLSFGGVVTVDEFSREFKMPTDSYFASLRINAGNFEFGYSRNMEAHSPSVGNKPEYSIYTKDAQVKVILESLYGKYSHTFNDKWDLQTSISKSHTETGSESNFVNVYSDYKQGFKYHFSQSTTIEEQITCKISEKVSFIGGGSFEDTMTLPKTGDLPFEYDKDVAADLQGLYYPGSNFTDKDGNSLKIYQDFYYLEYKNLGSYFQLQAKIKKQIEATLGARYDYNTRYGSTFNPRAGLVVTPFGKMKIKLLYGEAYIAPSPQKAYQHYGAFYPVTDSTGAITGLATSFFHLPNPDLEPEKLRSFEGNLSYFLMANFIVSVNGYYNKITNLIKSYAPDNTGRDSFKGIDVDYIETAINKGEAVTKGGIIKAEGLFNLGMNTTITSYIAYSYSDGDIDGKKLTFSAEHTVKAGGEFSHKHFSISPRLIYRSESYNSGGDSSDAYTLINVFARYSDFVHFNMIKPSVFVRVDNLTNQKYYNTTREGFNQFGAVPQNPICVRGGVTMEF